MHDDLGFNFIRLVGNLGADAEERVTKSGKAMTTFRMAHTRGQGETKSTMWVAVTALEDVAEEAAGLKKGQRVIVEGWLAQDEWIDADGLRRTAMRIIASEIELQERQASGAKKTAKRKEGPF